MSIESIISILKKFLFPAKNFDRVALDIPARKLNLETVKFLSAIKLFILILIACAKSTKTTPYTTRLFICIVSKLIKSFVDNCQQVSYYLIKEKNMEKFKYFRLIIP